MRRTLSSSGLALLAAAFFADVVAQPALAGQASGLLCARQSETHRESFIEFMQREARQVADCTLVVKGPIKLGELCIQDITFGAGFGVLAVFGKFCSADAAAASNQLAQVLRLQPESTPPSDGVASFAIPNGSREPGRLLIYRGEPSHEPQHGALSTTVSYFCVRQEGSV